jgi:hypothetical protein
MEIVFRAAFTFLFLWMITSVAGRSTLGAAIPARS